MASIQCERNGEIVVQLSLEEKASLDGIIKEAECSLESQELLNQSLAVVTENECHAKITAACIHQITMLAGALKNHTKGPMRLTATRKYAGHIVRNFDDPLNGTGSFSVSAMTDKGVKAAVVYSGKNKASIECGWLFAFEDTKAHGRKVYVLCGRKDKFKNVDWAHVERNLDRASSISRAFDKETGTSLSAVIAGSSSKSTVAITFSLVKRL